MLLGMRIRICVLYEFKLGHSALTALQNLNQVFGCGAISRVSVYRWYEKFRKGDENLEDKEPFSIIDEDELLKAIEENPLVSQRELGRRFGVGRTAIQYHLQKIASGKKKSRYDATKAEEMRKRKAQVSERLRMQIAERTEKMRMLKALRTEPLLAMDLIPADSLCSEASCSSDTCLGNRSVEDERSLSAMMKANGDGFSLWQVQGEAREAQTSESCELERMETASSPFVTIESANQLLCGTNLNNGCRSLVQQPPHSSSEERQSTVASDKAVQAAETANKGSDFDNIKKELLDDYTSEVTVKELFSLQSDEIKWSKPFKKKNNRAAKLERSGGLPITAQVVKRLTEEKRNTVLPSFQGITVEIKEGPTLHIRDGTLQGTAEHIAHLF